MDKRFDMVVESASWHVGGGRRSWLKYSHCEKAETTAYVGKSIATSGTGEAGDEEIK